MDTHPLSTPLQDYDAQAARVARQLCILAELTEMALDLARDAHLIAKSVPTPENKAVFDRVSRTVRQTLALETWITQGHAIRAAEHARTRAESDRVQRQQKKSRLRHNMTEIVQADPNLTREQRFRLEDFLQNMVLADDFAARPIPEMLASICKTLGIPPATIDLAAFAEPPEPKTDTATGSTPPDQPNRCPPAEPRTPYYSSAARRNTERC